MPTRPGSTPAATRSAATSRSPPWTRSTATRTLSTTSSKTRSPSSTRSTSSNSAPPPSTRFRRRVQQDIHGHRGRKTDPLYRIRNILRAGVEHLTDRQHARLESAFDADERHVEVEVAYRCAQQLRSVYHQTSHLDGRRIAEKILAAFPTCPIPEIARLGRTLNQWRAAFLGYFTTRGANNGGTEAVNGLIELARRVARGFRDPENYRLRMLLIGGGLRL